MKPNLKPFIILLSAALLFGTVDSFGQETLIKPPKPEKQTETTKGGGTTKKQQGTTQKQQQQSSSNGTTSQPTQSTQQTQSVSRPSNGYINGHEYVDLGLSVKWATCNVGANSPTDYGNYYAWGETRTKSDYSSNNCSTWEKSMGDIAGNANYDAARANWGGRWRLPTKDEIQELVDKCKWTWTTQGGHYGYKITGPNGNSIFLPAAGYRNGPSLSYAGEYCFYWSSSPFGSTTQGAYYLYFDSGYFDWIWSYRYFGQSVRPVSE